MLLLTWQPSDEASPDRTRRVVASLTPDVDGRVTFQYLDNTPDFKHATSAGFEGHPAFNAKSSPITNGVLETFLKRLPPRKREDFSDFLAMHRLPDPFKFSDLALLGYTGARLPSDGFALVPVFPDNVEQCDFILEVAGFRHEPDASTTALGLGDNVQFHEEENNPYDPGAIAIFHKGMRIGFVNRILKSQISKWMHNCRLSGIIDRINGKPSRPLVYVRISVTPHNQ